MTGEPTADTETTVHPGAGMFVMVSGTFYRGVDPSFASAALDGSRSAGRYSPADAPTLYLSSSREGVTVAMSTYMPSKTSDLLVLGFEVDAERIADLRDPSAREQFGVSLADAHGDWQGAIQRGASPKSWRVRDELERQGAVGLIDPSKLQPGLWHLVLFAWNSQGGPTVVPVE